MALKFYSTLGKGLRLNVRMFVELIYVWKSFKEKHRGPFCHISFFFSILNRFKGTHMESCALVNSVQEFIEIEA